MNKETAFTKSDDELRELLNRTVRLRLFRNTNDELGKYIEYNLKSNNSIKNIPAFTARCIFRELSRETYEQLDEALDLEDILDWYKNASEFYVQYIKGRKKVLQKENIYVLLKYAYIDDYQLPDDKQFLKDIAVNQYGRGIDMSILLLLMLEILPLYTSKKGDVEDIMTDFRKVCSFLHRFIECDELLYRLPVLNRLEKLTCERNTCNRAFLIYVTFTVLETYSCFSNSQNLYAANMELARNRVLLDVGDCFWVEPEMLSAPAVFWKFEQVATDDYFLYRYAVNVEKRQILYARYEAVFLRNNKQYLTMHVEHPDSTMAFLQRQQIFKDNIYLFACELDDPDTPVVIELWSILDVNIKFPSEKFIRLQDERIIEQLQKYIDGDKFQLINQYPHAEYNLWITPVAITNEYIYFSTKVNPEPDVRAYYRVPKLLNDGLAFITSNDKVGILEQNGRKYLAFVFLILYLDVTDEEACEKNGVDIVSEIVLS